MSKRDDFLLLVQTGFLMHFQNRCSKIENGFNVFGLGEYHGYMGDAVRASYRIPDTMNCVEASGDFMQFFLWQKEEGQEKISCPVWFSGLDNRHL